MRAATAKAMCTNEGGYHSIAAASPGAILTDKNEHKTNWTKNWGHKYSMVHVMYSESEYGCGFHQYLVFSSTGGMGPVTEIDKRSSLWYSTCSPLGAIVLDYAESFSLLRSCSTVEHWASKRIGWSVVYPVVSLRKSFSESGGQFQDACDFSCTTIHLSPLIHLS